MNTLKVYVGHDPREQLAYDVCASSIARRSNVDIVKLSSKDIPEYTRPIEINQSTDFTYTRFFVPYLNKFKGWALFVDCDFIFLESPLEIFHDIVDPSKAVYICKHPQYIPNGEIKMDGIKQHAMWRKNWASLMLFNCEHPTIQKLTPDYINSVYPGRALHTFDWVHDEEIGSLPLEWNTLDNYYYLSKPKAIHYTDGGPWFDDYKETMYSSHWYRELVFMENSR